MKIDELKQELAEGDKTYKGVCHDCGTSVTVIAKVTEEDAITIEGGSVYKIQQGLESLLFFKCNACFKKDKILRNFRLCEVWSRVVGYLRPVQQWNKGKKAEYAQRKLFCNTVEIEGEKEI